MPVNRSWINQLLSAQPVAWRATTDLANSADGLEQSLGMSRAVPGAPSAWTITAANGHFFVSLTPPAGAWVQYQLQSATDTKFDLHSGVSIYTLGLGAASLDVVDPGVTKFWRTRWRSLGSSWSAWRIYAAAAGVTALASGSLKTS